MKPYTPETLAERWSCTPDHVRRLCRRGGLTFFKLGKHIRIPFDEVERYESAPAPTKEDQHDEPIKRATPSHRYVPNIVPGLFKRT